MRRWLDRDWYRYLWHHYPNGALVLVILLLGGLAIGGYVTMRATAGTDGTSSSYMELLTTVTKRVPVFRNGTIVYKRKLVVKKIFAKPTTVKETRTFATPGGTQTVTRDVVSYRPVYRRKTIFVHGKPVTTKQIVTNTQMLTDTQSLTVTNAITNVVTNVRTATVAQASTIEKTATVGQTATQTATVNRTQTVSQTTTATQTVTAPPETVTQRVTTTLSAETVTVTLPRDTVTGPPVTVTTGG
jgi:hypothetical protein